MSESIPKDAIYKFAVQSNEIERIYTERKHLNHAAALEKLLSYEALTVEAVEEFVASIQPGAPRRCAPHHRVCIGGWEAPPPEVAYTQLPLLIERISKNNLTALEAHQNYEFLHPFMDGNGRSGRALWLWQMHKLRVYQPAYLFLQMYYYQTLYAYSAAIRADGRSRI